MPRRLAALLALASAPVAALASPALAHFQEILPSADVLPEGGKVTVLDGWQRAESADKGARWEPAELGAVVDRLIAEAPAPQKVYGT